jgi:hypothetical protein
VWHDDRDGNLEIYVAKVLADGAKPGPDIRVSDGLSDSDQPGIAWSGSQWGVVWKDCRQASGHPEIYFSILSCDPAPRPGAPEGAPCMSCETRVLRRV